MNTLTGTWRRLRFIAGPTRTPRRNLHLANFLALHAGVLNSVGFVATATYTSHMTGLTAALADHLVLGDLGLVGISVVAIVSFVVGSATCAILFNWGRRRQLRSKYASVLVLEASVVLLFGLLADAVTWSHRAWLFIPVLCFTMGLQNALVTKASQARIRTTHITGMVTDIGIELGKALYRPRRADLPPVVANTEQLRHHLTLVSLFFLGGVIGAAGYLVVGFVTLVPAAVLLLVLALPPLVADLRDWPTP
ncbi:YoaK family protein [Kribbia dieselivorans]|uniref:YoaK family protein n=1 Tax=Kribbia dieselivorans TaxID=331526 RepID=UPI000837D62B|nr:YoaK family protein [Kribbia dieselivorans]